MERDINGLRGTPKGIIPKSGQRAIHTPSLDSVLGKNVSASRAEGDIPWAGFRLIKAVVRNWKIGRPKLRHERDADRAGSGLGPAVAELLGLQVLRRYFRCLSTTRGYRALSKATKGSLTRCKGLHLYLYHHRTSAVLDS